MNTQEFLEQYQAFKTIDVPLPDCDFLAWTTWSCCEFHRNCDIQYKALQEKAIALTKEYFSDAKQEDTENTKTLFRIGDELMSVLSPRWWELITPYLG